MLMLQNAPPRKVSEVTTSSGITCSFWKLSPGLNASSLSWPHSPQRSLRKPCAKMPHSRKASNSSLMKPWQFGAGAGLGVGDEAGRVLLHQAVQRGLLGAVALVLDRGAIGRPLGLPADGLHDRLPKW